MTTKQEIFKALVNDFNMAGIFDIPAGDAFDMAEIDEQALIKSLFTHEEFLEIQEQEVFNEQSINNELSELFAAFGSGKAPDLAKLDTIETKKVKSKVQARPQTTIIDPRQFKNKSVESFTQSASERTKALKDAKIKNLVEDVKPEKYITITNKKDSKFILALPYSNLDNLKASPVDFNLLNNILKSIKCNLDDLSIIFINDEYKHDFINIETAEEKINNYIEKEITHVNSEYILSFGQEFLELVNPTDSVLRTAQGKVLELKNNKKLLANYSLSAMVNTPKYKSSTWFNLLLIKQIWN